MEIVISDPIFLSKEYRKARKFGVRFVDLDTLLAESDIVTLHVPLNPSTEKMIGEKELAKIKKSVIL